MIRSAFRELRMHKLRVALTAAAVVIGVAFVAGTFIFVDTTTKTFDDLLENAYSGVDLQVRTKAKFTEIDNSGGPGRASMNAKLVQQIEDIPGVAFAEGLVGGSATIILHGKPILPQGPPTIGSSWSGREAGGGFRMKQGRAAERDGEVAIDAATAEKYDIAVGKRVKILFPNETGTFRVVGIVGFGKADNLAGATMSVFDLASAQRYYHRAGKVDFISLGLKPTADPDSVKKAITDIAPKNVEVISGTEAIQETTDQISQVLDVMRNVLLVFAGVALFVGAFLIYNTFAISLTQRSRELALLRAIGALRGQVLRTVLTEAALIGIAATLVGIAVGVALAEGLYILFSSFGGDIPRTSLAVELRTIGVSLLAGITVTMASALVPAIRASRVPPVAAMSASGTAQNTSSASSRRTLALGACLFLAAAVTLALGLTGDGGVSDAYLVGASAALAILGVATLGSMAVRPIMAVLGLVFARPFGVSGRCAIDNATRTPRRTMWTAAALMIGMTVVTFAGILTASLERTLRANLGDSMSADLIAFNQTQGGGVSRKIAERFAAVDGVALATSIRTNQARIKGEETPVDSVVPQDIVQVWDVGPVEGKLEDLRPGEIFVHTDYARDHDIHTGDTVRVEFPTTGTKKLRVAGLHSESTFASPIILHRADFESNFTNQLDTTIMVKIEDGADLSTVQRAVKKSIKDFPVVEVFTREEFSKNTSKQIDQLLVMILVLLARAIVTALLGILNTLALSVFERTREIGLLRAVGMTRRQVRSMIRLEAVVISVYGTILGLGLGLIYGWAVLRALREEGFVGMALPEGFAINISGGLLLEMVLTSIIAGIIAAAFPARRAARMDVLKAIASE